MPVTTRSKSHLLPMTQTLGPRHSLKLSKTIKRSFKRTKAGAPKQRREPKGARSSSQKAQKKSYTYRISDDEESSQDPRQEEPSQYLIRQEQPRVATKPPSPVYSKNTVKALWPCQNCSCPEGIFEGLINSCIWCGHEMLRHHPDHSHPWNDGGDYTCEREELVTSILDMAKQTRVVVIRATPQVGKTTLLHLLGKHILMKEPKLEPIYIDWKDRARREGLPYQQYLEQAKVIWEEKNAQFRSCDPNPRRIYLIDEAQDSYEEEEFWTELVKNYNTRGTHIFVLVCVYGANGISHTRDPNIESQALRMHSLHRVELRSSEPGRPCMLFKFEETVVVVDKWAIEHEVQLEDGVHGYLHSATEGHPGMVGMLLNHFEERFYKVCHINVCQGISFW